MVSKVPHGCSLQVSFTLNEELTTIEGIEDKTVSAPREHPFTMQSVGGQMLAVFTENSSGEFPIQNDYLLGNIRHSVNTQSLDFCDVFAGESIHSATCAFLLYTSFPCLYSSPPCAGADFFLSETLSTLMKLYIPVAYRIQWIREHSKENNHHRLYLVCFVFCFGESVGVSLIDHVSFIGF